MANNLTDRDRDLIVRTIIGEANDQPPIGKAAVANVILNRVAAGYGARPTDVVLAPGQFEPWQTRAGQLASIPRGSESYRRASDILNLVMSGKVPDPTGGATHFLQEEIVRQRRGGSLPSWASGQGLRIAGHTFYAPSGAVPANMATSINRANKGNLQQVAATSTKGDMPKKIEPGSDEELLSQFGITPTTEAPASAQADPDEELFKSFVAPTEADAEFDIKKAAAGERHKAKDFGYGVMRGGKDVIDTLAHGLARGTAYGADFLAKHGLLPPEIAQSIAQSRDEAIAADTAGNKLFKSDYGDNNAAKYGRIGGQIGASMPIIATGAGALSPILGPAANAIRGAASGNKLLSLGANIGTSAVAGAGMGAAGNALTMSASDEPAMAQISRGALVGGAVGAAAPIVSGIARWGGNAARSLAEPFTEKGQDKIVNNVIAKFGEGGPTVPNTAQFVPGSQPTLAQATGNPGLATLERAVRDVRPNDFTMRAAQNAQARELAVDALRGDAMSLNALVEARSAQADALRGGAFAKAVPVNPEGVVNKIDEILKSPAGQRDAVVNALTSVRDKIIKQTDPAQLYGVRQAISDMMSPLADSTSKGARLASKELGDVTKLLDKTIEAGAPGYRDYMKTFAEMSKPVDTQKLLQGLNLTDSKGNITLGKIDSALKRIEKAKVAPGLNDAKSIPENVLSSLYAIRDDLVREGKSSLGKSIGSNTFQNLATNNLMGRISAPLAVLDFVHGHNPLVGLALSGGKLMYGSQNDAILNRLTEKMLNPAAGAAAFRMPAARSAGAAYAPAAAVIGANRLLRSQEGLPLRQEQ